MLVLPMTVNRKQSPRASLPVLLGQTDISPHASLFFEMGNFDALHWGDWKIVKENQDDLWQLYNIKTDISETDNVSSLRPDLVKKLGAAFDQKKSEIQNYLELEKN
ncbi:MAG: hypothetical protein WD398_04605 [Cyclobacteriaceae bacterium]